jgi:hypothetical protein
MNLYTDILFLRCHSKKKEERRETRLPSSASSSFHLVRHPIRVTMNKNAISQAPDAKQEEEDKIINIKVRVSFGSKGGMG